MIAFKYFFVKRWYISLKLKLEVFTVTTFWGESAPKKAKVSTNKVMAKRVKQSMANIVSTYLVDLMRSWKENDRIWPRNNAHMCSFYRKNPWTRLRRTIACFQTWRHCSTERYLTPQIFSQTNTQFDDLGKSYFFVRNKNFKETWDNATK